jgi:uncharacterized protein involved in type VI secretion and phage assembly
MPATYTSQLTLKINGQTASAKLVEDLLQVTVEESLHLPGMFTLVIRNDYYSSREGENPWLYDDLLSIGKSIELGFTSSTTSDNSFSQATTGTLLKGEITAIEAHFNAESQAPIVVRGYDSSHRLHRGRYNRSFNNMTDTDIVKQVIGEVGISPGTIDSSGGPYGYNDEPGYVFQENQTNMEFLRERAARNGFELFVQDGKLNFRKPVANTALTLKWLKEITDFQVRVSSAEQVSSVEVRGWDYTTKKAIVSTKSSQTAQVITSTNHGNGKATSTKFSVSSPKMIVVDQPVWAVQESDTIAQSLYNELSGEFVQADAKAIGNPDIRPGKKIALSGMGKYSGNYYVTEARHILKERVYTTEFSIRGLRDDNPLATIAPKPRLQPGQTLMIGIVTNNNDPKKWGRVRVKFPTLTEEHNSDWARVISIGAGKSRGFDCLPEVNDEVLVGFEHGDIHRPFVIGGIWNGSDTPPIDVAESVADGKVRLRTIKTRTGHTLQFVEEDKGDSKKGIYLTSVYGHEIHLNDSTKSIHLKTKDGHKVELSDDKKSIVIETKGGNVCKLEDQGNKITLSSKGEIQLSAQQKINLKVGGNSIEITTMGITEKNGGNKLELAASGVKLSSAATMTVEGLSTTVKGSANVSVSAPMVSLG